MFKAIISRDNGEPWGPTGMTTAKWLITPIQAVPIADLIATQPGVLFRPLIDPTTPVGGDTLPHVIDWDGGLYLEDGHHRTVRAAIAGERTIRARVLKVGH